MKISIVGGGNVGLFLAAYLSKYEPTLFCSNPKIRTKDYTVFDVQNKTSYPIKIKNMTDSIENAVRHKDLIIVTLPSHVRKPFLDKMYEYLNKETLICFITGAGGAELTARKYLKKNCYLCGFQRTPFICRVEKNNIYLLGQRKEVYLGAIPFDKVISISNKLANIFDIKIIPLPCYLSVTFNPTNPIMHIPRLYELFKDYRIGYEYKKNPLFYEEWNDDASLLIEKCEKEVSDFIVQLTRLNMMGMHSVFNYFHAINAKEYTKKMREFNGFKGIKSPMIKTDNNMFIPDFSSRYFTEDIPYGLVLYKCYFKLLDFKSPNIDKLILYFQKYLNKNYIDKLGVLQSDSKEIINLFDSSIVDKLSLEDFYLQSINLDTDEKSTSFINENFKELINPKETIE